MLQKHIDTFLRQRDFSKQVGEQFISTKAGAYVVVYLCVTIALNIHCPNPLILYRFQVQ